MSESASSSGSRSRWHHMTMRMVPPEADGLQYVRNTSYAMSDETAMHSAEPVEVMACAARGGGVGKGEGGRGDVDGSKRAP